MRFFDIVDILIIAFVIYKAIEFFKESRAGQLLKGIALLFFMYLIANWFELVTVKWLLLKLVNSVLIIAVIIFQPEIRRVLEKMGHSRISYLGKQATSGAQKQDIDRINNICKAVSNMQEKKIGALIVFERKTPLGEIIDTGTLIDAAVSTELVQNIFFPKSPLHDGSLIIRNDRIVSAGCILPLTANNNINSQLGTRHRAAIGVSEVSDAVVIVVSEETGIVSVAKNGSIKRNFTPINLRDELLTELFANDVEEKKPFYFAIYEKIKGLFSKKN
ncbi:MAG: diadenylate cyclase CdaA [Clostridia bacterium]|nr:diadenylate cyclase CdaA [Clostridia bacterium]